MPNSMRKLWRNPGQVGIATVAAGARAHPLGVCVPLRVCLWGLYFQHRRNAAIVPPPGQVRLQRRVVSRRDARDGHGLQVESSVRLARIVHGSAA